jgi:hypothetical protein
VETILKKLNQNMKVKCFNYIPGGGANAAGANATGANAAGAVVVAVTGVVAATGVNAVVVADIDGIGGKVSTAAGAAGAGVAGVAGAADADVRCALRHSITLFTTELLPAIITLTPLSLYSFLTIGSNAAKSELREFQGFDTIVLYGFNGSRDVAIGIPTGCVTVKLPKPFLNLTGVKPPKVPIPLPFIIPKLLPIVSRNPTPIPVGPNGVIPTFIPIGCIPTFIPNG